ncbi:uncharacterized protein [Nicotiana sylvestris]|uniref:uncharacterized protein n=1 Tax=Nicotiana sylvestris TaxID=4096 RepID=UPI00388CB3BE
MASSKGRFISYLKARKIIIKGYDYHLVKVKTVKVESPTINSIHVVNEFPDELLAFIGHIISGEGIWVDTQKIEAVKTWPIPMTPTEVRNFLDLADYYTRLVKGFSSLIAPLSRVPEKKGIAHEIHQLASLGVRLLDLGDIGITIQDMATSSLVTKVEERQYRGRLYVPNVAGLRQLVMGKIHNSRYSIHLGVTKMYYDIKGVYWWDRMKKDIAELTVSDHLKHLQETFDILRKHNRKLNPEKCAFGVSSGSEGSDKVFIESSITVKSVERAWSITHIPREESTEADTLANLGSFAEIKGFDSSTVMQLMHLVLDADDYYEVNATNLVEAGPYQKLGERKVVHFLWENIICRFWIPKEVAYDNGPQFIGAKVTIFLEDLKIKKITSSPYHPSANGQAESTNKVIIQNLKKRLEAAKGRWPEELPGVLWLYRTIAKSSTGETPFSLVYGADALILVEVWEPALRYFQADKETNNEAL